MSDAAKLRSAATVVLVREAADKGLELLLLQRAEKGDHNSGAWVFPGGLVDAADRECHVLCKGLDDTQASAQLALDSGGLDAYIAAVRECFEEAGVLYAVDADDRFVSPEAGLLAQRLPLKDGACTLAELCRGAGLRLAADRLFYIGHWVTPVGRAKRFDTRFFVAALPPGQQTAHDAVETTDHVWITPARALNADNTRRLMRPTRAMIEQIGAFDDLTTLLAWARSPRVVPRVLPVLDANGEPQIVMTHPDAIGKKEA